MFFFIVYLIVVVLIIVIACSIIFENTLSATKSISDSDVKNRR